MATIPHHTSPYLTNAELARLIRDQRRLRRVSNELGAALLAIAGGVWDRYKFTDSRDDFVGDCVLHLLQGPLRNADVRANLFGYFSTCAIRFGKKTRGKKFASDRRETCYRDVAREIGRRLTRRRDSVPSSHAE